jgi:hypothetical protein
VGGEGGQPTPVLDPGKLHFFRHGDALRLTVDGECSHLKVCVLRVFPLSEPSRYFSLRDEKGTEIGLLVQPQELRPEDQKLIAAELERRYLMPVIRRVLDVKDRLGTVAWQVETDRGMCRFSTRDLRESVTRPVPGRYILTDVDGNRYDVPDLDALDAQSQTWLLRHI